METLKKFFRMMKWWEYIFLVSFYVAIITVSIVFKTNVVLALYSIIGATGIFLTSKGMVSGQVVGLLSLFLFCTSCFFNRFYGEIICAAVITFPCYVYSIVTWIKTKKKGSDVISINRNIKWFEYVIVVCLVLCLSVGIYFLLKKFDTANLIVSTISTSLGVIAGYFQARRCEYNFALYLVCNVISIVLWFSTINEGNLSNLPMIITYFVYLCLSVYGTINWIRLKRKQKREELNCEISLEIEK